MNPFFCQQNLLTGSTICGMQEGMNIQDLVEIGKYSLTEEMVMKPDATYRCARVTLDGKDVGHIRLPDDGTFEIIRSLLEGERVDPLG